MLEPLRFRCTACGNCCRTLRVAVTSLDVRRLARATGKAALELVDWLPPDSVDMSGEPQSFVELSSGRRLMVLAHASGGCALLARDDSCSAYTARPSDCRAYPFHFEHAAEVAGKRRLTLLPLHDCEYAEDGALDRDELERIDAARFIELTHYQRQVAHWNRWAWHRRRLGKPVGSAQAFLDFTLTEADVEHCAG